MNIRAKFVTSCAALLIALPTQAHALKIEPLVLPMLSVEVGMDKPTRDLLNSMPANVRAEVVKAVNESRTLIDESVEKYLKKIDEIMEKQVASLACRTDASIFKGLEYLRTTINPFKRFPTTFTDLQSSIDEMPSDLKWEMSLRQISQAQANYLAVAVSIGCASKGEPNLEIIAGEIAAQLNDQLNIIRWTSDQTCKNATDCMSLAKEQLKVALTSADSRDLADSKALERLNAIAVPEKPTLLRRFDGAKYIASLREIAAIDRHVKFLTGVREAAFDAYKNRAQQLIDESWVPVNAAAKAINASYPTKDAKFAATEQALNAVRGITEDTYSEVRRTVSIARDAVPRRAAELNAQDEATWKLPAHAREFSSGIRRQLDEQQRILLNECADKCNGSASRFCPSYTRRPQQQCDPK